MTGQRRPGVVEQWRAFGAFPPAKRAAMRTGLAVTTAVLTALLAGVLVLFGRACIALFIAGWHATGW